MKFLQIFVLSFVATWLAISVIQSLVLHEPLINCATSLRMDRC